MDDKTDKLIVDEISESLNKGFLNFQDVFIDAEKNYLSQRQSIYKSGAKSRDNSASDSARNDLIDCLDNEEKTSKKLKELFDRLNLETTFKICVSGDALRIIINKLKVIEKLQEKEIKNPNKSD